MNKIVFPLVMLPVALLGARPSIDAAHCRISPSERTALTAAATPTLSAQRAGAARGTVALSDSERATLTRAHKAAPALGAQRAGELHLSDRELKIIAIVLLAVLVVAAL